MRTCLPGQKSWSQGVCTGLVGPQSYGVKVGESTFVRNRRQLIRSDEQPLPSPPDVDDLPPPQKNPSEKEALIPTLPSNGPTPNADPKESSSSPPLEPCVESPCPGSRRSTQIQKPPDWITNYAPT